MADWNAIVPSITSIVTLVILLWNLKQTRAKMETMEKERAVRDKHLDDLADIADLLRDVPDRVARLEEESCSTCTLKQEHVNQIAEHSRRLDEIETVEKLVLKAMYNTMLSLKDADIDGHTEESITEIRDYLLNK